MTSRIRTAAAASLCGVLASAGLAQPVELTPPEVAASINLAGDVDLGTFNGLLRKTATREERAIQEYDISQFAGMTVLSATIRGTVAANNGFDNGPREFDFGIYSGDGVATPADFSASATVVGNGSYAPPTDSSFDFSFDVTAEVQAILDGGGNWAGLLVVPTSSPNFPNILIDDDGDAVLIIEAEDMADCPVDLSSPTDPGVPDGALTGADFFQFLDLFSAGDLAVDFSSPLDPGVPDGALTGADFFEFLNLFSAGC